MCVLFFAYRRHPRYRLVFAGNRDEFYRRPAAPAAPWSDCAGLIAGRDLEAAGTWLGVRGAERWAVVTNVRDLPAHRLGARSRGALVSDFLCSGLPASDYAAARLNLGLLLEDHLHQPAEAVAQYREYYRITGGKDLRVLPWIAEIEASQAQAAPAPASAAPASDEQEVK